MATSHRQRAASQSSYPVDMSREAEPDAASSAGEDDGDEEDESIAATRPRREPKAPQSLYTAPTELRKRRTAADAELAEYNRRQREARKRLRDTQSRGPQRHKAGADEAMAEAEHEDDDGDDADGGRNGFMSAPRAKRRKSLYGTRRKHRGSDADADGQASGSNSDRNSAGTLSEDERRQQDTEVASVRQRRGVSLAGDAGRIVIHIRARLTAGRDNGGKFCGIRKYQLDRITGLHLPPPPKQHKQQSPPSPQAQRSSGRHPPAQDSDHEDVKHERLHGLSDDSIDSSSPSFRPSIFILNSQGQVRQRRERSAWPPVQLPKLQRQQHDVSLRVLHVAPGGEKLYGVLPDATLVVNSKGTLALPSRFDYGVFRRGKLEHEREVVVKKEVMDEADVETERHTRKRTRSSGVAFTAPAASAATTRSTYAQHSLTSSTADNHSPHNSHYSSSSVTPSRHSLDTAEPTIPHAPPATFPPSPPASPPGSPRPMHSIRSMPSLDYDLANVRAGTHPLYLAALEQVDRLRGERQQAVERLKRERLAHVDDLYAAEMKQVQEEWKDEARGLQARIIDQLTTQHRYSALHHPNSPTHPDASATATTRTTRRRHLLPTHPPYSSRTVTKRYHAEYCLPAVERRADVDRCRRLIEDVLGGDEGGELLRRVDDKLDRRRERGGGGMWRRAYQLRDGDAWGGSGRHDDSVRGMVARAYAAARKTRNSNGRF